ncbi:unnamed protein product [Ranitomeya imitator]|uniref:Cytochrome P450 n=1 Tax=Ranitomeya imitator TaxID=111125 RepID=A0ABN9L0L4_9NEOB|nr:unnamed protein product [Ranitomeya imitator]
MKERSETNMNPRELRMDWWGARVLEDRSGREVMRDGGKIISSYLSTLTLRKREKKEDMADVRDSGEQRGDIWARELYDYYPFLGSLLGLHKKLMQNIQDLRSFISKWSMNRRLDFNANNITGYIDAYLLKQEQEATKAQTYFNEENLLASVLDLFSAGTETTSTTIQWGILLMMKYPEIQKKVQEEIKTHIKPGQLPTVEDRKKMPYTDAVIHEIQRFGNILPLNGSHSTPTDVYLRGYLIPKGIEVIPFLTSVLYDKTQWKTPYDFNPNHFLDENGKFVRPDAFMPFSVGRRACAGESLAKMELFLFFTGLLQAFTFYPPPGVSREDLSLKPGVGLTLVPTPYMTCAKPNY